MSISTDRTANCADPDQTCRNSLIWVYTAQTCLSEYLAWIFYPSKTYRILPNYRSVHLGFSKLLGKLVVKYLSTYTKGTLKKDQWRTYLMMLLQYFCVAFFFPDFLHKSLCCGYPFELHRQVDALQMGTHSIYLYREVEKSTLGVIRRLQA